MVVVITMINSMAVFKILFSYFPKLASDPKTKAYYEILLFKQDQGLQQIVILHEEGDTYANDITTRILNSVELKKASN